MYCSIIIRDRFKIRPSLNLSDSFKTGRPSGPIYNPAGNRAGFKLPSVYRNIQKVIKSEEESNLRKYYY